MRVRYSARLILLSPEGRLLLFHYHDGQGAPFWATAGGELQEGETYEQAAKRELDEETGFDAEIGQLLRERDSIYAVTASEPARWLERYYLVRYPGTAMPSNAKWTEEERKTIRNSRWWSLEEMLEEQKRNSDIFKPSWLPELLKQSRELL